MTRDDGNQGVLSGDRLSSTRIQGFNGDEPIESTFPESNLSYSYPRPGFPPTGTIPTQVRPAVALTNKLIFARLAVPLFAASFSDFSLTFADGGRTPTGFQDIVVVNGARGREMFRLLLDTKTHLPFALTLPAPVGIEQKILISDYKTADGLTWPHQFTTTVNGKTWQDEKIGKFAINQKIDPKIFTPAK